MTDKFHERFDIEVGLDEAKRRFVERVHNLIFEGFMRSLMPDWEYLDAVKYIAARLGDQFSGVYLLAIHNSGDFLKHLHAIEALHDFLETKSNAPTRLAARQAFDPQVREVLD